jgi:glutathione synthase
MKIAFQMDHPASLDIAGDSTIALMEQAAKQGAECYYYAANSLSWQAGEVTAQAQKIRLSLDQTPWYQLETVETLPLSQCQYVLIRQDPPFDMHYITATYLLEQLPDSVRVLNDPAGLRNASEKLSALSFPAFIPPTLISEDDAMVYDFIKTHQRVVAKPLYGYGGHDIFRFDEGDINLPSFLEHWRGIKGSALVWQAFLPAVADSECRILMVNGEVKAAFGRIPPQNSIRSNMRVGGTPVKMTLSAAQIKCAQAIGPYLKQHGLRLAGVDMIGPYLMEMNVTSPTGIRAAQALYNHNIAEDFWKGLL